MCGHDHAADEGVEGVFAGFCACEDGAREGGVGGVSCAFLQQVGGACCCVGFVNRACVEAGVDLKDEWCAWLDGVEGPDAKAGCAQMGEHGHAAQGCGADRAGAADLEDGFGGDAADAQGALWLWDVCGEFAVDVGSAEHAVQVRSAELSGAFVRPAPEALVKVRLGEPLFAAEGSDVPEVWAGACADLAREPCGEAEAEVEADDHVGMSCGECEEPVGNLVAGAAALNAYFACVPDGGDDVASLACGVDTAAPVDGDDGVAGRGGCGWFHDVSMLSGESVWSHLKLE